MPWLDENKRFTKILARLITPVEKISKEVLFDCRMCGQCILHSTGMTCPMRCPKNLRNGPCGGVRPNGNCEVFANKPCVWVHGIETAPRLPLWQEDIHHLQPPVDWKLQGTSSWINLFTGRDQPQIAGWKKSDDPASHA